MFSLRTKRIYLPVAVIVVLAALWYWQSPQRVATAAARGLGQADTQHFDAEIKIGNTEATTNLLGEAASVSLQVAGVFDRQEAGRDSLDADIILVTESESVSLKVEAEAKFIGDEAYVKINKSPAAFPALVELKGQWLVLPRGGDDNLGHTPGGSEALFTNVKRAGAGHLTAEATPAAFVSLLDNIANLLGTNLTAGQIDNIRSSLNQVDTVPVELDISSFSHELQQLSTTLNMPNQNTVEFTLALSERNQPTEITVPEGAKSLGELLGAPASP